MLRARPARVLVAESDNATLDLASTRLTLAGYEVAKARSGREAVDVLRSLNPQCCVLDLRLPGMDGFAMLRWMQRTEVIDRTSVLVLTDRPNETDLRNLLLLGAKDYLGKPFKDTIFLSRVRRLLSERAPKTVANISNDILV